VKQVYLNLPGCLKTPKAFLLSGFFLDNLLDVLPAPPDRRVFFGAIMKGIGEKIKKGAFLALSAALGILLWQGISRFGTIPSFILPSPGNVWDKLLSVLQNGSLFYHTLITLQEVLSGLFLGLSAAIITGYFLAKSPIVERVISPYIVASQSIPIVAIAPLLVIWLGPGLLSKILTSALIVFFPVLVNTIVGLRSVPEELYDLMKSLQASPWQRIFKLEIPAALPVFLGGLRIGATLAVIGAVVGEFVGADKGLGFLVNVGRGLYDTSLVFVAVFTLVLLALGLYGSVVFLESRLLSWQKRNGDQ
jgi:NitT/TauT family transport system permease protein